MGKSMGKKIVSSGGSDSKFRRVDLHIHTPASKCYTGERSDAEYLKMIAKAKKDHLEVIAFTDHNSIAGYRKLIEIKQNLNDEKRNLEFISDSRQASERLKEINRQLALFEGILILPGVEFEVKNGIHLLVIFNDTTPIETIEAFLRDGGYDDESYGYEDSTIIANWDIFELYDESMRFDCIVLDAHTDSNKGIYNTIPKGNIRANCFKSPQLLGVCYSSEKQKDQLERTIKTAPEYKRQAPVSFLRFSDAHQADKIGNCFTWFDLSSLTFSDLKLAFLNPTEKVSVEAPAIEKILAKLIKEDTTFPIPEMNVASLRHFQEMACALNNSMDGTVLFGVTNQGNKIGISTDSNIVNENMAEWMRQTIESKLTEIEGRISHTGNIYNLQNGRIILSLKINKSENLVNIKGEGQIFAVRQNAVQILSAKEVQSMVEGKSIQRIEDRLQKRIVRIEKDCLLMKNLFRAHPIIKKFENSSIALSKATGNPRVTESLVLDKKGLENIKKGLGNSGNGRSRGNLFIVESLQVPRLKHAYLRYTLPVWYLKTSGLDASQKQEQLIIAPGGALYYSKNNTAFYSSKYPFILRLRSINKNYTARFVAAFLKSSFWIWYCQNKFESVDIFLPELFQQIILPDITQDNRICKETLFKIEEAFDAIIKAEKHFLTQKLAPATAEDAIHNHNRRVDSLAYEIDIQIYKLLNLSEIEILAIESGLRAIGTYLPTGARVAGDASK